MNSEKLAEELRGKEIEDCLWTASCKLEVLKKETSNEEAAEDLWEFEQRLDRLREEISELSFWLVEQEGEQ